MIGSRSIHTAVVVAVIVLALVGCRQPSEGEDSAATPEASNTGAQQTQVIVDEKIAFIREGDLWLMNPDGSGAEQLTVTGDCSDPAWSPDGKQLVYVRRNEFADAQLWTLDVATLKATQFTQEPSEYSSPRWSPDGSWLACLALDTDQPLTEYNASLLVKIDPQTGTRETLQGEIWAATDIAWSPDSSQVAVARSAEGTGTIAVFSAGDGTPVHDALYETSADTSELSVANIAWPTSDQITFSRYAYVDETELSIWRVTPDGDARVCWRHSDEVDDTPHWTCAPVSDNVWLVCWVGKLWLLSDHYMTQIAEGVEQLAWYGSADGATAKKAARSGTTELACECFKAFLADFYPDEGSDSDIGLVDLDRFPWIVADYSDVLYSAGSIDDRPEPIEADLRFSQVRTHSNLKPGDSWYGYRAEQIAPDEAHFQFDDMSSGWVVRVTTGPDAPVVTRIEEVGGPSPDEPGRSWEVSHDSGKWSFSRQ